MSSYFASITSSAAISNLSTRFTSLRRAISSDETDDPDSEDSSHISNVLRAYYAEKGRVLPPWLPPDPKAPATASPALVATQASRQQGYGEAASMPATGGGRGGLGDLWGDDSSQQRPAQQTMSLRRPRAAPQQQPIQQQSQPLLQVTSAPPTRPNTSTGSTRTPAGYLDRPQTSQTPPPSSGARPLPSQRAGSYQTSQAIAQQQGRLPLDRTSSSGSAQDRLRARLHGGSSGGGGSSGSGSAPPTLTPGYNSGGGGGGGQPYVAAGRPWESGDSSFGGGYGTSAYGRSPGRNEPTGLPSGPRPPRGAR